MLALVSPQIPRPTPGGKSIFSISLPLALWLTLLLPGGAWPLTPDSPEVKDAIEKGIKFLETTNDGRLGGKALVGLTLVKAGRPPSHKQVDDAIKTIQASLAATKASGFNEDIYSTGVAIMFLVAVNPRQYRYEIEDLVKSLHRRQKAGGAWGYPVGGANGETCDSSMTQFALIALWEAQDQAEVISPIDVWERAGIWILKTQDPNGGFGYQGVESKSVNQKVKQSATMHSMTVASMCSLYIVRDRLGLARLRRQTVDEIHPALRLIENDDNAPGKVLTKLDPKLFKEARALGNHWISDKFTIDKPTGWLHYYLYGLERYETFRQMEVNEKDVDLRWYEVGSRFLIRTQEGDGSWKGTAQNPPDTCFSVLFLLRSMKKSLERSETRHKEGILVGGEGAPAAGGMRMRDGKLTELPTQEEWKSLGEILANPEAANFKNGIEQLYDLAQGKDRGALLAGSNVLIELAKSANREVRMGACQAMANARHLNFAPSLIRLLSDDDVEVSLAAKEGLVTLSRRRDAHGFNARGSDASKQNAIARWKEWYASLRPDADLD